MNHELSNFDPEKSAIQTFARLTIISGMRIARRKYFTRKNYLLFSAQDLNLFENGDDHNVALGCVVNRFVLYYANVKKGYRENGECIRTT